MWVSWGEKSLQISIYACTYSYIYQRLNAVKTPPPRLAVCTEEWEGCIGVVGLMVCRPLTSCITGSISQSWFQWGGGQSGGKKWRNEKSDENETGLIFWRRQLGGDAGGEGLRGQNGVPWCCLNSHQFPQTHRSEGILNVYCLDFAIRPLFFCHVTCLHTRWLQEKWDN